MITPIEKLIDDSIHKSLIKEQSKEIIKFTLRFREGIIGKVKASNEHAYIINLPLETIINQAFKTNFKMVIVPFPNSIEHCFLIDKNDIHRINILDATADQFNNDIDIMFPEVFLGEMPKIYQDWIIQSAK